MRPFVYDRAAQRVIFGPRSRERLAAEVARLNVSRALILSTPAELRFAEDARRQLGALAAGVFADAVMHVPIETARAARQRAAELKADCCVAIGGGSTIGLGKAIALESEMPIVAVPTTYAGSEMTPIYGLTEDGLKNTGRDWRVLPRTVLYDPELTVSLPPAVSGASGMNALAHCVEALYAEDANPIVALIAVEGIRALSRSLPVVVREPANLDARSDALYGAWLGGTALGGASMAIHHKLCHTLGGSFNLPHAEVHTVILPHAAAYNRDAAPEAMRLISDALSTSDAARGLYELASTMGLPTSLKEIGMREDGLDHAARLATTNPYHNPRPIEYNGIRQLLEDAYWGRGPG